MDLQLTRKSTHPIKGSPWLLLSIANIWLSQGKSPLGASGCVGLSGQTPQKSLGCKSGFVYYRTDWEDLSHLAR